MSTGSKKRGRVVALGLALAAAALVAGVSVAVAWRRSHSPRHTLHLAPRIATVQFLGDGRSIAVASDGGGDVQGSHWDAFSLESGTSHGSFPSPVSWGKRSTHALFTGVVDGKVHFERKDVLTLERVGPEVVVDEDMIDAALSAGEETIAVLTSSGGIAIRRSETGALVKTIPVDPRADPLTSLILSEGRVALRREDGEGESTSVYSLATGQNLGHWSGGHADGQWMGSFFLGFTSTDDLVFRVSDQQGDHLRVVGRDNALRFDVPANRTAAISASGTRIAISAPVAPELGAFAVEVLSLDTGAVLRTFPRPDNPLAGLALSPEGDAVAIASEDGTVEIWDVPP